MSVVTAVGMTVGICVGIYDVVASCVDVAKLAFCVVDGVRCVVDGVVENFLCVVNATGVVVVLIVVVAVDVCVSVDNVAVVCVIVAVFVTIDVLCINNLTVAVVLIITNVQTRTESHFLSWEMRCRFEVPHDG